MKRLLCLLTLTLNLTLATCGSVVGVPDYDSTTGRYSCPAGQVEDLNGRGVQICRSR